MTSRCSSNDTYPFRGRRDSRRSVLSDGCKDDPSQGEWSFTEDLHWIELLTFSIWYAVKTCTYICVKLSRFLRRGVFTVGALNSKFGYLAETLSFVTEQPFPPACLNYYLTFVTVEHFSIVVLLDIFSRETAVWNVSSWLWCCESPKCRRYVKHIQLETCSQNNSVDVTLCYECFIMLLIFREP